MKDSNRNQALEPTNTKSIFLYFSTQIMGYYYSMTDAPVKPTAYWMFQHVLMHLFLVSQRSHKNTLVLYNQLQFFPDTESLVRGKMIISAQEAARLQ